MAAAVNFNSDRVKLTEFGNLDSNRCFREYLSVDEFIVDFFIHYTSERVIGISYVTSIGIAKVLGKESNERFKFTFNDQYQLIGLFGSSSKTAERVYSLGAIRVELDCN